MKVYFDIEPLGTFHITDEWTLGRNKGAPYVGARWLKAFWNGGGLGPEVKTIREAKLQITAFAKNYRRVRLEKVLKELQALTKLDTDIIDNLDQFKADK